MIIGIKKQLQIAYFEADSFLVRFISFLFIFIHVSAYVCACVSRCLRRPEESVNRLELGLQIVVCYLVWGLETESYLSE